MYWIDDFLEDKTLVKHGEIERQLVTGGIFYCRDSVGFSVSASNKLSCNLTGQYFEIGNKNILPSVMHKREKTNI